MSEKRKAKIGFFWLEGQFWADVTAYSLNFRTMRNKAPQGDGHAVLVIPGFLASDVATAPMRSFLSSIGYTTYGWEQGTNHGPSAEVIAQLEDQLDTLCKTHGKVSLIGWSLGGVFARELARRTPEKVRQVITLGSPFNATREVLDPDVVALIEKTNGRTLEDMQAEFTTGNNQPPQVPCTAVYSKLDSIVPYEAALETTPDALHANVEVVSSHMGLVVNCSVTLLIADRLAQPCGPLPRFAPKAPLDADDYPFIS